MGRSGGREARSLAGLVIEGVEAASAETTAVEAAPAEAAAAGSAAAARLATAGEGSGLPAEAPAGRGGQGLQTFRSLRHRDYRLLWLGTLFSGSGQWIQQVTVGWLIYELTGSAFLLGAVTGLRSVPMLTLGPIAGVAADRVDRKRLLMMAQIVIMVASAIFALDILLGQVQVWHVFLFAAISATAWAFNMPVRHSLVPNLVPRRDLMNALALNGVGFNSTRVLGPAVAGGLIAALGAGQNFLVQSAACLIMVLLVAQMRTPPRARASEGSVGANLKEGLRFVWRHRGLRTQMSLALAPMLIALPYLYLMPIFARDVLEVGPAGLGMLTAAPGVGAVIGTLIIASLDTVRRKGLLLLAAVFLLGVCLALFSFSRSFPLSLLLLVFLGAIEMVYMTTNQTLVQMTAPDELRGRVMGIYTMSHGMLPLGSLLSGTLAGLVGAPTAVLCMGLLVAAMAVGFAAGARTLRGL